MVLPLGLAFLLFSVKLIFHVEQSNSHEASNEQGFATVNRPACQKDPKALIGGKCGMAFIPLVGGACKW